MKSILKKFNVQKKNLNIAKAIHISNGLKATWNSRNYNVFGNEAFIKNVIVNKSISTIAKNAASVEFLLYTHNIHGERVEITKHTILDLLNAPNIYTGGTQFIENVLSYQLLSGNAYILCNKLDDNTITELYTLRPDRVVILTDGNGQLAGYRYMINGRNIDFPFDSTTGASDILHIKNFHPLDDLYGLSAVESAHYSIEQHNESLKWNKSLLQNGARPSGAVVVKPTPSSSGMLTDEQYERLRGQVREEFSGSANAGKFLLLEGGMEWQEISLSPKDMDFLETKNSTARDIALAFGIPPQLLGISGDNTYNNMAEARLALWEETIIPLLRKFCNSMSKYFSYHFNENIILDFDIDQISALNVKRETFWNTVNNATFLTNEEKRKMLGF